MMSILDQKFVDREDELETVDELLAWNSDQTPRIILYRARPAVGFTQFLRYIHHCRQRDTLTFYVDASNRVDNSVFSQILVALGSHYHDRWFSHSKKVAGSRRGRMVLAKAIEGVPYFGPLLGNLVGHENLPPAFVYSAYPSAAAELLCQFLVELAQENRIVVLIDNAQDIDASSLDLIRTTATNVYGNVRYLFGYVERGGAEADLNDLNVRISSLGYRIYDLVFPPPGEKFVLAIAGTMGIELSRTDALHLIALANGNVYRLLAELRSSRLSNELPNDSIDKNPALRQEILWYLTVAQQSIRKSDLYVLCSQAPEVFYDNVQELDQALTSLQRGGLIRLQRIPGGDTLVELQGHSNPETPARIEKSPRSLIIADRLYSYYARVDRHGSGRHSGAEIAPLLYRLSKIVAADQVQQRGEELLASALSTGSVGAAENLISEAVKDSRPRNFADFILSVVFRMSLRHYTIALNLLKNPTNEDWKHTGIAKVLLAFCLNRCRKHSESEEVINQLLNSPISLEIRAMLLSFKISGKLHENDVVSAQQIFSQNDPVIQNAQNYAYFLRNAAAAFDSQVAYQMLNKAASFFKQSRNRFGLFTTLNNLGVSSYWLGKNDEALTAFQQSREGLEMYGIHHLHIVENNLGLVFALLENEQQAKYHLKRAMIFSNSSIMPQVYSKLNIALLHALMGEKEKCQVLLDQLRPTVENASFDRMAQKYFPNAALILAFLGAPEKKLKELCQGAENHPDRALPERTLKIINAIELQQTGKFAITKEILVDLHLPCFLQYWYQNPLELLPEGILSSDTICQNMLN